MEIIMKKTRIFLLALSILVAGAVSLQTFGDDSDPLISKSYLDKRIGQVDDKIDVLGDKVDDLELKVEKNQKASESSQKEERIVEVPKAAPTEGSGKTYKPLHFDAGESIYLAEGTEFIVRSGLAKVIDPLSNGLPDLTNGDNLELGEKIPLNHMILCPRSDGRGIQVHEDIWIMIKGPYSVGMKTGMRDDSLDIRNIEEL